MLVTVPVNGMTYEADTEVRVGVYRKTDSVFLGSMPAVLGMKTQQGTITKLNPKSVVITYDRITSGLSVDLAQARKCGWPKLPGCRPRKD